MALDNAVSALRCRLCRNGLLSGYDVYRPSRMNYGVWGEPELYSRTVGYFYSTSIRHSAAALEIAGNLGERVGHDFRLLVFDRGASAGDLVLVGDTFYKVGSIRQLPVACRILELEVDHIAPEN